VALLCVWWRILSRRWRCLKRTSVCPGRYWRHASHSPCNCRELDFIQDVLKVVWQRKNCNTALLKSVMQVKISLNLLNMFLCACCTWTREQPTVYYGNTEIVRSKTELLHFTFHKFGMSSRTTIRRQSDDVFQLLLPPLWCDLTPCDYSMWAWWIMFLPEEQRYSEHLRMIGEEEFEKEV